MNEQFGFVFDLVENDNFSLPFQRYPKSLWHIFKDTQIIVAHFKESQIVVVHFQRDPNCHCTFLRRPELCGKITFELKRMKTWLKNVAHNYVT